MKGNFFLRIGHSPSFLPCQIRFLAHFMLPFFIFLNLVQVRTAA